MNLYVMLAILILVVCVLLVLIVLVQNSKGGGLASNFSSSNQYMGVRKTADFLEKSTWTLAIVLLVLSLASIFTVPSGGDSQPTTQIQEMIRENPNTEDVVETGITPNPDATEFPSADGAQ